MSEKWTDYDWVDVKRNLPKKDGEYFVMFEDQKGEFPYLGYFFCGEFHAGNKVAYWTEKTKPKWYKEKQDNREEGNG